MLVLSRKVGEQIRIGADICVTVVSVKGGRVTLGVEAPREIPVNRSELIDATRSQRSTAQAIPCLTEAPAVDRLTASMAG